MNPIQSTAWNLWYTLTDPETTTVYQLAIAKTWQLLKQAARLIVLVSLMVTAFAFWVLTVSFHSGRTMRAWLEEEQPTLPQVMEKTGQFLLAPVKPTLTWVEHQMETQLQMDIKLLPPAKDTDSSAQS